MNRALDLVSLQSLDDDLAARGSRLATVRDQLASDPELDAARATLAAATATHRAAVADQKRLEAQVAGLDSRIGPEEKRLYDGSVGNPKDLQNIQLELQALGKQKAAFEEELLSALAAAESAQAELTQATSDAAQEEARHTRANADLVAEQATLESAVLVAEQRLAAQRARIPKADLVLYEQIRKRRGVAVARITGHSCAGCHVTIPDMMRRRAMSAELAQCPNCERILYLG